jgi:hypothetical protein
MAAERAAPPAVVILGADAVLAAMPATAVQLLHACRAAGFDAAVPASWGDELVARECAYRAAERGDEPAILCACPCVAERLVTDAGDLDRFLIPLVAPPVATARYLRALAGGRSLRLTFVGACPSGREPEFDQRFTPAAFLGWLAERGIVVAEQPTVFEGVLPPDRRRHYSLPGGFPTREALDEAGARRTVVEILSDDFAAELAERLLEGGRVLLDLSPRLGCSCSGAAEGVAPRAARPVLATLEPPRAPSPVVDHTLPVALERPLPPAGSPERTVTAPAASPPPGRARRTPAYGIAARLTPAGVAAVPEPEPRYRAAPPVSTPVGTTAMPAYAPVTPPGVAAVPANGAPRRSAVMGPRPPRLTPVGVTRLSTQGVPRAIDADGRRLPRAYVARRRTPSASTAAVPAESRAHRHTPAPAGGGPVVAQVAAPSAYHFESFVAGVAAAVADQVPPWRVRLGEAIAHWRAHGYATAVLERAYALPRSPDVDGLLATYAAAVEHLRALESAAISRDARWTGATVFRDPERVAEAESVAAAVSGR